MSGVLRFDQLQPDRQAAIQKNLQTLAQHGASPDEVESYLRDDEKLAPAPHLGTAAGLLSGAAQGATFGFADEALGGIDAANALLPKALGGKGIPLSQFGQQYRATRDMIRGSDKQFASEHPVAHTAAELAGGLVSSLGSGGATVVKQGVPLGERLLSALHQGVIGGGLAGLGAGEGSAPEQADNAVRGAMTGAVLGPAATLAGAGVGGAGKMALNKLNLRPSEPITFGGMRLPINTVDEEATNKVAGAVAKSGKTLPAPRQAIAKPAPAVSNPAAGDFGNLDPSAAQIGPPTGLQPPRPAPTDMEIPAGVKQAPKPQTLMELGGQPVARLARTARSASPAAGQKIDQMLTQRTAGAPDRAIDDALEASGLKMRTSAFQTTQALMDKRAEDAAKAYGAAFQNAQPITDPRIQEILDTDAGKKAWTRAQRTMSNMGIETPVVATEPPPPAGIEPANWQNMLRLAKEKGLPLPSGPGTPSPNLQQLHFLKLAMDDLMEPGLNRGAGEGGIGRTEGRSILGVQKKLLAVMDNASPAYQSARQEFADQSALVKANDLGQQLFKMSPDEASAAYQNLGSESEKKIFRRAGMDALADRLENGPADVGTGVAKPRDQRRIQLIFDNNKTAFQEFKDRIAQEAEMVGTHRFVSGGSQTADKLADLSDMLGLGTVAKAATGNLTGAAKDLAGGLMKMRGQSYGSRLGESIANMTTAGGNGDQNELARAIQRLQAQRPRASLPAIGTARPSGARLLSNVLGQNTPTDQR